MTYINMIYLALLTTRTPVIPPFAPSHVANDGGFPPFGDIFDVPRLASAINAPVLEWRDVKQENSTAFDELGCWTIWGLVGSTSGEPRGSKIPYRLGLGMLYLLSSFQIYPTAKPLSFQDVAYTALPKSSAIINGYWLSFWTLAKLSFPSPRTRALEEHPPQTPTPGSHAQLPPNEQLLCFDFMYYIGAQDHDEWWEEWSPAWRMVGRHARWERKLERVAVGYIQRALGVEQGEEVPPVSCPIHFIPLSFSPTRALPLPDLTSVPFCSTSQCMSDAATSQRLAGTPLPTNVLRPSQPTHAASPLSPPPCPRAPSKFPHTTSLLRVTRPLRRGGKR